MTRFKYTFKIDNKLEGYFELPKFSDFFYYV